MTTLKIPGRETQNPFTVYGRERNNLFTLHGDGEDVATYAIGFVLANSPSFLAQFMKSIKDDIKISDKDIKEIAIELQKYRKEKNPGKGQKGQAGRTDIELGIENNFRLIVEAKRWWAVAGEDQLEKYANLLTKEDGKVCFMTISQANEGAHKTIKGIPVIHRSWKDIQDIVRQTKKNQSISEWENTLLMHLYIHLENDVFNEQGNVCILPLSDNRKASDKYSFREIVTKGGGYFHPPSGRYPRKPPEYLGFRWNSELHVVHKVKKSTTGHEFRSARKEFVMDEKPMWQHEHERQHVIYHLDDENHLPGNKPLTSGKIGHRGMQRCNLELLQSGKYETLEAVLEKIKDDREKQSQADWQKFLDGK